jgi:hypothetical protein
MARLRGVPVAVTVTVKWRFNDGSSDDCNGDVGGGKGIEL